MQAKIHADAQHAKTIAAARMRFFHGENITHANIHEHTTFHNYIQYNTPIRIVQEMFNAKQAPTAFLSVLVVYSKVP